MVKGIGIDIIEIHRIEKALARNSRFQTRLFTPGEIQDCEHKPNLAASLAARFAAKEATFKALGSGWELGWVSVEVVADPRGPKIRLEGRAAEKAAELGVQVIKISLTHSREYAAAVAVALGAPSGQLEVKA